MNKLLKYLTLFLKEILKFVNIESVFLKYGLDKFFPFNKHY